MVHRIRTIMEYCRMSQQDFARKIGTPPSTLSGILKGKTQPSTNVLMGILDAFPHLNSDWLLRGKGEMLMEGATEEEGATPFTTDTPHHTEGTSPAPLFPEQETAPLLALEQTEGLTHRESPATQSAIHTIEGLPPSDATYHSAERSSASSHAENNSRHYHSHLQQPPLSSPSQQTMQRKDFSTATHSASPTTGGSSPRSRLSEKNAQRGENPTHGVPVPPTNPAASLPVFPLSSPTRVIKEIRVFYDDNTFESFIPG